MADGLEFYYWPTPNGWKVSILLEELGLPYRLRLVNIAKGEQFTPEFAAISPNQRMPAPLCRRGISQPRCRRRRTVRPRRSAPG